MQQCQGTTPPTMSTLASRQVSVEISALLVPICQARNLRLLVPFPDVASVLALSLHGCTSKSDPVGLLNFSLVAPYISQGAYVLVHRQTCLRSK